MPSAEIRSRAAFAILAVLLSLMLVVLALPRFITGLKREAAGETIALMIDGRKEPLSAYRSAAAALAGALDGESLAERAELLARASNDPRMLAKSRELAIEGLARAPADPRAWTLLCAIEAAHDPGQGVSCLDTGFFVGPYDWYATPWRMQLAASEWSYLDERLRDAATALILPMWHSEQWGDDNALRATLFELSKSADGRQLLRAGFLADKNAMRRFNRWVMRKRIDGS